MKRISEVYNWEGGEIEDPIPFNPKTMTVTQLLEAAEMLRLLYNMTLRGDDADEVLHVLQTSLKQNARR